LVGYVTKSSGNLSIFDLPYSLKDQPLAPVKRSQKGGIRDVGNKGKNDGYRLQSDHLLAVS